MHADKNECSYANFANDREWNSIGANSRNSRKAFPSVLHMTRLQAETTKVFDTRPAAVALSQRERDKG
jgi:hypothetical protein